MNEPFLRLKNVENKNVSFLRAVGEDDVNIPLETVKPVEAFLLFFDRLNKAHSTFACLGCEKLHAAIWPLKSSSLPLIIDSSLVIFVSVTFVFLLRPSVVVFVKDGALKLTRI